MSGAPGQIAPVGTNLAPCVTVFGIQISDLSRQSLVEFIVDMADSAPGCRVYNVNAHALNLAYRLPRFRSALAHASLVYNDGYGVILAARLAHQRLRHRHTVADWLDDLLAESARRRLALYLLGDEEPVLAAALERIRYQHPTLRVAGCHHGFFAKTGPENDAVVTEINRAAPDILLVGFGMPTQELWIEDNVQRLKVKVMVPVGAAFRWYSGVESRAPRWATDNGLEWLSRLYHHPIRLFRRYAVGNPLLLARLIRTYWLGFGLPC